jgi:hypothetical protein
MEIVLAILLFFGGLTLGSMQSSTEGSARQADAAQSDREDEVSVSPANPMAPRTEPMCHTQEPIYRDLTVPRSEHAGYCDGGCLDE